MKLRLSETDKIFTHDLKALTSRFVGSTKNLHGKFSPGLSSRRIFSAMTPARSHAHGLVSPSPLQHWLNATLCVIAELVRNVAARLGMRNRRQARVCDTIQMPEALPLAKRDTPQEETTTSPTGLMLSLSKHEAVLTVSHTAPASFDTLRMRRSLAQAADTGPPGSRPARAARQRPLHVSHALVAYLPGRRPATPSA
ncbi:MAG: hypothetical protein K2X54_23870 [Methylobacterium organophilum]|nr:hypothetical protein [Methylobacterium organophilum]